MKYIIILIITFILVFLYSALKLASIADDKILRDYKNIKKDN